MRGENLLYQIGSLLFLIHFFFIHCNGGTAVKDIFGFKVKKRKYAKELGLISYKNGGDTIYCTGTIINSYWLVTSRHCFQTGTEIGSVSVNALSSKDKKAKSVRFSEVVVHGDFVELEGVNDIALVKTEIPMDSISSEVKFAYLMTKEWPVAQRYNRSCRTVHYMQMNSSSQVYLYRDDVLGEVGPSACRCRTLGFSQQPPLRKFQGEGICAHDKNYQASCYAHTAAPLFCDGELVGIGHLVVDCEASEITYQDNIKICQNGRKNLNTFTGLFHHTDWMKSKGIQFPNRKLTGKAANIYPLLYLIIASVVLCNKIN